MIWRGYSGMRAAVKQVTSSFTASCGKAGFAQPPTEKCAEKARANEPKPPRVTLPDPESGEPADDAWFDPVSLLKKPERDDHDPPWPPPEDDPLGPQFVACCVTAGAAMPGDVGWQPPWGIRA
jgi:hypothetical protein